MEEDKRPMFECCICGFRCPYEYYGTTPPHSNERITYKLPSYFLRDPFSASEHALCVGISCSLCGRMVCLQESCCTSHAGKDGDRKSMCDECMKL